jgi:hypothetical protein
VLATLRIATAVLIISGLRGRFKIIESIVLITYDALIGIRGLLQLAAQ